MKGKLDGQVSDGFVLQSWNSWVEGRPADRPPEFAGVRVEKMADNAVGYPCQLGADHEQARLGRNVRAQILGGLRDGTLSDPDVADFLGGTRLI